MSFQRCSGVVLLALWGASAASADVMLVQMTRIQGRDIRQVNTTSYYKGIKVRVEQGEDVRIDDGKHVFAINTRTKTYVVLPNDQPLARPILAAMKLTNTLTLRPGEKPRTIQGKPAQHHWVTLLVNVKTPPGADPAQQPSLPPITSKTELWAARFAGVTPPAPSLQRLGIAVAVRLTGAELKRLGAIPGIPLESVSHQRVMGQAIQVTTKATRLVEKPLPDTLFAPPKGFKEIRVRPRIALPTHD